ncbi:hypothetical protein L915_03788 [Phytophthora nicotianae]|uniref:Phospholipase D-like domain-containing protein n=3 Tax=Phytophthora nicotianae TaxID=4792 RepID=V9FJ47_PHYNI|nr:hypothetical protein F443_06072 [Phytophthora nicotianae P1569]ETK92960.1 hypothetical protein L915_03788 [Phytophthora nicotianae]ETL46383.1 hypothetical protein L916_03727 [Phytophthora nicotianae]
MMHYKLLAIWNEDSAFAVGGSANLTKAAWTRNDEFIFHVEGHGDTRTIRHTSAEMCPYDSRGSFSDETLVEREPIFQRALTRIAGRRFLTAEWSSSPSIAQPSPSYGRTEDTPPLEQPTWWNDPHIIGRY